MGNTDPKIYYSSIVEIYINSIKLSVQFLSFGSLIYQYNCATSFPQISHNLKNVLTLLNPTNFVLVVLASQNIFFYCLCWCYVVSIFKICLILVPLIFFLFGVIYAICVLSFIGVVAYFGISFHGEVCVLLGLKICVIALHHFAIQFVWIAEGNILEKVFKELLWDSECESNKSLKIFYMFVFNIRSPCVNIRSRLICSDSSQEHPSYGESLICSLL